jgi:lipopolysaccharide transport system ATP-binding protein
MYVRLAFSVAAHLDTDILLVDEVLSVGDVKFQQKCMGKMQDRAFADKTILFVSHNLAAIGNFCTRAILLEGGQLAAEGDTRDVLRRYLSDGDTTASRDLHDAKRRSSRGEVWQCMRHAALLDECCVTSTFFSGGGWRLRVECVFPPEMEGRSLNLGFVIQDMTDRVLIGSNVQQYGKLYEVRCQECTFEAEIPQLPLVPGRYRVSLYLGDGQTDHEIVEGALQFEVAWQGGRGTARPPHVGVIQTEVLWK